MDFKKFKKKGEYYVDKLIPFALVLLTVLLVIEFFFKDIAEKYHLLIIILHNLILADFVLDLIFKYLRIRKFKKFLKSAWLDILAIFPFYLIFRVFEEIILLARAGEEITKYQGVIHLGTEASEIAKELEEAGKIERLERVSRMRRLLEPISKIPRFIKGLIFYEKPKKH